MTRGITVGALAALVLGCGEQPAEAEAGELCSPVTCADSGSCGTLPDGCGGSISCGDCPAGQSCGAGGANRCGATPTSCLPTTCAALGKTCGEIADGCGGSLSCGVCPPWQGCGADGTPNVCSPREPAVGWTELTRGLMPNLGTEVLAVGSDRHGRRYSLSIVDAAGTPEGIEGTIWFKTHEPDGTLVASRGWWFTGAPFFEMSVLPGGDVYLGLPHPCCGTQSIEFPAGGKIHRVDGPAVVRLDPEGSFVSSFPLAVGIASVDVNERGSATVQGYDPYSTASSVMRLAADGTVLWARHLWWSQSACKALRSGDVVCAEALAQGDPSAGVPGTVRVARLAGADGSFVWVRDFAGIVSPHAVEAGGDLVFVAATRAGTPDFPVTGATTGDAVLLALGDDGEPRWSRTFDAEVRMIGARTFVTLAVDGEGRSVFGVQPPECAANVLHAHEPDGSPAWTMRLPTDGSCSPGPAVSDTDLGDDGALFVGGSLHEAMVFGAERLAPHGQEGFVTLVTVP